MIINNAQVQMTAKHEITSIQQETVDIQFWRVDSEVSPISVQDNLNISLEALNSVESVKTQELESLNKNIELEVSLLKMLVEKLTGKKIEFINISPASNQSNDEIIEADQSISVEPDWGLSIDISTLTHESETLSFEANAFIQTSDGKEINASLAINYSSSFSSTENFSLRAGQALKDPLVLNFNGSSLELANTHFEFDLDIDGQVDQVPALQSNSAFLALDKNHDGIINDGAELFGALSGNGFQELDKFDTDNNQWIDENDAIFTQLKLFSHGSNGETQLISLTDKGVGAIYLGNVSTPFRLTDTDHNQTGQLRSSGLFLMESGEAGSIQQIDLAV